MPPRPDGALKVPDGDDDVKAGDLADLPGLRTTAEWERLTSEQIEALGDETTDPPALGPPQKPPAKRTPP